MREREISGSAFRDGLLFDHYINMPGLFGKLSGDVYRDTQQIRGDAIEKASEQGVHCW